MADYDLAIIGGGLNGVCIARDAAGRGLRVILLEQGDLGSAASSASPRLIHGDLALLEQRALPRVRAALAERDTLLRIAPHLVRPMRFAIPAHSDERPLWLLRAGLWLYDRLSSHGGLQASTTVDITHHPIGNALKRPFGTAFDYSDCVADDSRLVIANALDAAERGATIRTGARCVRAEQIEVWRLVVIDRAFVINLGRNPQSAAIIRAVISLGHGLEMSIVAEGVETEEQLGFLTDQGCDAVQGYFIGRPLPIAQYAAVVGRAAASTMEPARKTG